MEKLIKSLYLPVLFLSSFLFNIKLFGFLMEPELTSPIYGEYFDIPSVEERREIEIKQKIKAQKDKLAYQAFQLEELFNKVDLQLSDLEKRVSYLEGLLEKSNIHNQFKEDIIDFQNRMDYIRNHMNIIKNMKNDPNKIGIYFEKFIGDLNVFYARILKLIDELNNFEIKTIKILSIKKPEIKAKSVPKFYKPEQTKSKILMPVSQRGPRIFVPQSVHKVNLPIKFESKLSPEEQAILERNFIIYISNLTIDQLDSYLKRGVNINAYDGLGNTALLAFLTNAKYNELKKVYDVVKYLVEHGANINITNKYGYSPLGEAAKYNKFIVNYLLDHGADPNLGNTLFKAIELGDLDLVKNLLNYGADINSVALGYVSYTPLTMAISKGKDEIAKYLIDYGADIDFIPKNDTGRDQGPALEEALDQKNQDIFKYLIEHGANVHLLDYWKHPILDRIGREPEFKKIYDDYQKRVGNFFNAVENDDIKLIIEFLNNNMLIDVRNTLNKTALMYAALKNKPYMVRYLLAQGADLDLQDNEGNTALIIATKNNNLDIADILINSGANAHIRNNVGYSALDNPIITDMWQKYQNSIKVALENYLPRVICPLVSERIG